MQAILALEDGSLFHGRSFTGPGEATAEVCFNTSMTGYQEVITDPSYKLQMVAMTYPLVGNYGINDEDSESGGVHVSAFLMREYQPNHSNWRARKSLADFLVEHGVLGVTGIDTRRLTRKLRLHGVMKGIVSTQAGPEELVRKAQEWPGLDDVDAVARVTCSGAYRWRPSSGEWGMDDGRPGELVDLGLGAKAWRGGKRFRVAAYDFGVKYNILRHLNRIGAEVIVMPAATTAEAVLGLEPDGIFLSNGPGDPAAVKYAIENIRRLIGQRPIFGICLGQQLLGLALGGRTYKLKFGHRGGNQPVKDLLTGKVEITAQNHGFNVDLASLDPGLIEPTHVNLNDNTLEGFRHRRLPLFCVQYHPENSPGPHDANHLFDRFAGMMAKGS